MKNFLAPIPLTKPAPGSNNLGGVAIGGGGGVMPMGMNKIERGGDENKFNKVMDWGTPRLVTK